MTEKLVFQAERKCYSPNQVPGWMFAQEISKKIHMIRAISKHIRPTNAHPSSFTKQVTGERYSIGIAITLLRVTPCYIITGKKKQFLTQPSPILIKLVSL
jgi:hypothetical protein